jgi:16S rRNA processing protein RimM
MTDSAETIVVGRIGKPHGVRGEVSVEPRTDEPERRFATGTVLQTQPPAASGAPAARPRGPAALTVAGSRWHSGRLLLRFEEIADRDAAEQARGTLLVIPLDPDERPADPEEFYDHQLVGLRVRSTEGAEVGTVTEVVHGPAQDLLVVRATDREVLVPFVAALVPTVDLDAGWLEVADRPGLLDEADRV